MKQYVVLDIETQKLADEVPGGWENIPGFGIAVVGVTYVQDFYHASAYYVDPEAFPSEQWEKAGKFEDRIFEVEHLFDNLYESPCIVTFNGINFDYEVLRPYGFNPSLVKDTSYDILHEIEKVLGHRVSLESAARVTLGVGKSGDGKDAPKWFRDGEVEKVFQYCIDDVDITLRLYEHILKRGYINYFDRAGRPKQCRLTAKANK